MNLNKWANIIKVILLKVVDELEKRINERNGVDTTDHFSSSLYTKFGLKGQINAAAVITALVFLGLAKATYTSYENVDHDDVVRYGLIALTCLFSLILFIASFFQNKTKSLKS